MHGGPDGSFRATFEDKPLLSDTVFLRAWVAVDLPRFYNPVTNLLAPPPAPPAVEREHRREEVRIAASELWQPTPGVEHWLSAYVNSRASHRAFYMHSNARSGW